MKERTARCCCGDLSITVSGDPHYVHRCHCDYCQRRTGSVYQVSCWYPEAQVVSRKGEYQLYETHPNLESSYAQGSTESSPDVSIEYKFCKRCGSTVYWEMSLPPGVFGSTEMAIVAIAVGCFFDPDFPVPVEDHYVEDRHRWVEAIAGATQYDRLPPPHDVQAR